MHAIVVPQWGRVHDPPMPSTRETRVDFRARRQSGCGHFRVGLGPGAKVAVATFAQVNNLTIVFPSGIIEESPPVLLRNLPLYY